MVKGTLPETGRRVRFLKSGGAAGWSYEGEIGVIYRKKDSLTCSIGINFDDKTYWYISKRDEWEYVDEPAQETPQDVPVEAVAPQPAVPQVAAPSQWVELKLIRGERVMIDAKEIRGCSINVKNQVSVGSYSENQPLFICDMTYDEVVALIKAARP